MAATQHFMDASNAKQVDVRPAQEISLAAFARGFTRLIAVALLAAAAGLWLAPRPSNLPELILMKLCASFFLGLTGFYLFFAARQRTQ